MIFGSFLVFGIACLCLLLFPPLAFVLWLVSVIMFFVGVSARGTRKEIHKMEERRVANEKNETLPPEQRFRSVKKPKSPLG